MNANVIDPALREELAAAADRSGCELLHCEFAGGTLRLVLDRPEGVTLEDCQTVSKQVSALLDVADFGAGRYLLEVTSPGLDRKFYRRQDFERFQGHRVRVTFSDPEGARRTVVARLESYLPEGEGTAVLVDESTRESYSISLKKIQLARLAPEL